MALISLLASIVIATAEAGGPQLSPTDQVQGPIRVVSSTHEVDFPEAVTFRLQAEADSPITQVRLYYRLARLPVNIYGYPEFTPSTSVTADFEVRTSGASYIPSGVDIQYFYEIRDASGNTFETERYTVEYLDPRFRWQRLRHGNLQVLWHDMSEDRVSQVVGRISERLEEVKSLVGLVETPPIKAVLVNDLREARRSFPTISAAATRGHVYGGFAFDEYDLFVLAGLSPDPFVHEVTHLLLGEALDSPFARVPAWLNEGLAMYFESGAHRREPVVEQAARDDKLMRLSAMNNQPGRPRDVSLFYAQSWSLVDHMIDAFGVERMSALLAALGDGSRVDEAVPEVYGFSLQELESRWRSRLLGETRITPPLDPGTIGTSVLLAGAALLAAVATSIRWYWRKREPSKADGEA